MRKPMRHKAIRATLALAVSVVAYALYGVAAAPLMEPHVRRSALQSSDDWESALTSPTKTYEPFLSHFFSADSWVMQNPKLLESEQSILLIKDYEHVDAKTIRLAPFAMILFPSPGVREDPRRSGEAIVLESPEAILDFDRPLDLSRAKIGNLVGGRLTGKVTIRSDQNQPGPADDLLITTTNVTLSESKIETLETVQFRLGGNVGGGRLLRMHFPPRDAAKPTAGPRGFGGMQSIELIYDVKMHFQMAGKGLLPAATGAPQRVTAGRVDPAVESAKASARTLAASAGQPPIEITSQGPFRFDFVRQEASFERQVDVLRLNPIGESDHLSCDRLSVDFAPRETVKEASAMRAPALGSSLGGSASGSLGGSVVDRTVNAAKTADARESNAAAAKRTALEVRRLRAVGRPVIVRSPSTGAAARCEKLEYDVKTGKISLEDPARVMLRNPSNEVSAPKVSYTPGAPGGLPSFEAIGAGWLESTPQNGEGQHLRATWDREFRLRPHQGQHLLSVLGKAELAVDGVGSLAGEEIWLWMTAGARARSAAYAHENRTSGSDAGFGKLAAQITPDRMLASGGVKIRTPQLHGDPERFEVWFQPVAQPADPTEDEQTLPDGDRRIANRNRSDRFADNRRANDRFEPIDADRAEGRPAIVPHRRGDALPRPTSFEVSGKVLRVNVLWGGAQPAVDDVEILGGARFVEVGAVDPRQGPLAIRGEEVRIAKASTPQTVATIRGKPAVVAARGLTMSAAQVNLDRGANRIWIDGQGELQLPAARDLQGQTEQNQTLAATQPMTIAWRRSMEFDGESIRFKEQVEATSATQRLTTQALTARLAKRVDFATPPQAGDDVKIAALLCQGGVSMENRTYVNGDLTAHDILSANDLAIDQTTGAIVAHGPGVVRSHRRGAAKLMSGGAAPVAKNAPVGAAALASAETEIGGGANGGANRGEIGGANAAADDRLTYMELHFQQDATGNLNERRITLADQIDCLYGPVRDWAGSIAVDKTKPLPEGVVSMKADRLTLSQPVVDRPSITSAAGIHAAASNAAGGNATGLTAIGGRAPIDLAAEGNTFVEGSNFTARADRITYAEGKQLLILEGTGRADAILTRQAKAGGPQTRAVARKIFFWQSTNTVEVDDAKSLNLSNLPEFNRVRR
jgi:hypothetical protein